jgi:hypothetical protein
MKRILFLMITTLASLNLLAQNNDDSILIYPKPIKNILNISKLGNDTFKFNIFLYNKNGYQLKSAYYDNKLNVNDLPSGDYVLELRDNNQFYRYFILIEN